MRYTNYTTEDPGVLSPNGDKLIRVKVQCPFCPNTTNIVVALKSWVAWETDHHHVQDLWPSMGSDDREALISGMCVKCWTEMEAAMDEGDVEPGRPQIEPTGLVTKDAITCPACGATGPFLYLEDIVCFRKVIGAQVDEEGEPFVLVHGLYETGEGFDEGTNPRLLCKKEDCLHEFTPINAEGEPVDYDFQ